MAPVSRRGLTAVGVSCSSSHNFPSLQHLLAAGEVDPALLNEVTSNQKVSSQLTIRLHACRAELHCPLVVLQMLQYIGLPAGGSLFTLNDVVLDTGSVDIYYLLKLLSQQSKLMAQLQQAGVPATAVPNFQALA